MPAEHPEGELSSDPHRKLIARRSSDHLVAWWWSGARRHTSPLHVGWKRKTT